MVPLHGSQGPDEPRPHRFSTQPSKAQGQRHRPANLRLELNRVESGGESRQPRLRTPPKREPRLVALDQDRRQSHLGAERAELGYEEQGRRFHGNRSEAIA